jgi:hypothetical protein
MNVVCKKGDIHDNYKAYHIARDAEVKVKIKKKKEELAS